MALFTAFDGRLGMTDSRGLSHLHWADRPAARLARRVLRLPRGEAATALVLSYNDSNVSDTWTRQIGRRRLVTRCWVDGSRLIEQFGPFGVVSEVTPVGRGLRVTQSRLELFGFRVPSRFAPALRTRTWRVADGTLVSATTWRGPSGRVLCRNVSAMRTTVALRSVRPLPVPDPAARDTEVVGDDSLARRRELKLVG